MSHSFFLYEVLIVRLHYNIFMTAEVNFHLFSVLLSLKWCPNDSPNLPFFQFTSFPSQLWYLLILKNIMGLLATCCHQSVVMPAWCQPSQSGGSKWQQARTFKAMHAVKANLVNVVSLVIGLLQIVQVWCVAQGAEMLVKCHLPQVFISGSELKTVEASVNPQSSYFAKELCIWLPPSASRSCRIKAKNYSFIP